MKKILLTAIAALMALSLAPAHADEPQFRQEGQVLLMAPQTKAVSVSATEGLNPCGQPDPDLGDLQGVDGYWFELTGFDGAAATMTSTAVDADVWFYNEGCAIIKPASDPVAYSMATDATANEAGTVPADTFYVVVDVAVGAASSFVFEIA